MDDDEQVVVVDDGDVLADEGRACTEEEQRVLDVIGQMAAEGKKLTVTTVQNVAGCTRDTATDMLHAHRGTRPPRERIAELEEQLDAVTAERDDALRRLDEATAARDQAVADAQKALKRMVEFRTLAETLQFSTTELGDDVRAMLTIGDDVRELVALVKECRLAVVAAPGEAGAADAVGSSSVRPADGLPTAGDDGAGEGGEPASDAVAPEGDGGRPSSGRPADDLSTASTSDDAERGRDEEGSDGRSSSGRPASVLPTAQAAPATTSRPAAKPVGSVAGRRSTDDLFAGVEARVDASYVGPTVESLLAGMSSDEDFDDFLRSTKLDR